MTAAWYLEFVEAIDGESPTYRRCESCGAVGLPPRRICPECHAESMAEATLSTEATVVASAEVAVTIPKFSGETPYTVVIAEFEEGVRLTGQLRGSEEIDRGTSVELGVEKRDEEGWVVTFSPASS